MNKAEIISKTLKAMMLVSPVQQSPFSEEQDEEALIVSILQDVLPNGVDILTCEDFKHLGVQCCDSCHDFPQYDMSVINLPYGGKAWVCDTVKLALYSPISGGQSERLART